jgi:uncharacterized protein YndB with AHSA1/START domain
MGSFTIAIDIARGTHEVFAYVSDVARMPLWYEAVQDVRSLSSAVAGVDARYEMTRDLPGGRFQNEIAVREYETDRLFTIESVSGPTPFRYRYRFEPNGGATRLHLDGEITGAGLPGPIAHNDALATQAFKRGMGDNLQQLRRLIEAS